MTQHNEERCDVLIIGAGMAGASLARQIRLQQPDLSVINLDRRDGFSYWIGESTVEAWEDYLGRSLGLGDWLRDNFPEKHGLRMFWDNPEHNLPFAEMSEFGRSSYHPTGARHLDRIRFDTGMAELNRQIGVDVRLGVSVASTDDAITLDREQGHLVQTSGGPIRCTWLVDAGGRGSPLARKLGLVTPEARHRSASSWVRVRRLQPMDSLGSDPWRARVNHKSRLRSTNHFLYKGYWFWFIALDDDVVSLGVEYNREHTTLPVQTRDELIAFARQHRALDELLGPDLEVLDFMAWPNLPRCASQHFSADRWFLTGMSGFFADVMGSGTSRIYAECNRLIGELIRTDRAGEAALHARQLHGFNNHMRASYESFLRFLRHYEWFGSFDLFSNYFGAGLATYFNATLPNNMADLAETIKSASMGDLNFPEDFPRFFEERVLTGLRNATHRLAGEFYAFLEQTGSYYRHNAGQYHDSLEWEARPDILDKLNLPRDRAAERASDRATWRQYVSRLLTVMCEVEGLDFDEELFDRSFQPCWSANQSLGELLAAQRGAGDPLPRPVASGSAVESFEV